MSTEIIDDRLRQYAPESKQAELNAFKEIAQEITLAALSRSDFFTKGAFQGGTCLRIVYKLQRFSEDLDFILYEPVEDFAWQAYLNEIQTEFMAFGLSLEVIDRSELSGNVKKAFLKENSFGQVLSLSYARDRADVQTAKIKLEIDTRPPLGSDFESKIINFPSPFSIVTQTLPSLFSGKLHALLCRSYVKGRDWYDFVWYVSRKTSVNFALLQNALGQQGLWADQSLECDKQWLLNALSEKINTIDWDKAKKDIMNFIKPREQTSIAMWSSNFYLHFVDEMDGYLR